jgi:hypothetical protein
MIIGNTFFISTADMSHVKSYTHELINQAINSYNNRINELDFGQGINCHSCVLSQCIKSTTKTAITSGHTPFLQICIKLPVTNSHTNQFY